MQETSPPNDSGLSISGFRYNHKAFNDALEFKRIHDPAFKDIKSHGAFAEKFGISESTVKRLFSGKANDFMTSLLWYSCRILGLPPHLHLQGSTARTGIGSSSCSSGSGSSSHSSTLLVHMTVKVSPSSRWIVRIASSSP